MQERNKANREAEARDRLADAKEEAARLQREENERLDRLFRSREAGLDRTLGEFGRDASIDLSGLEREIARLEGRTPEEQRVLDLRQQARAARGRAAYYEGQLSATSALGNDQFIDPLAREARDTATRQAELLEKLARLIEQGNQDTAETARNTRTLAARTTRVEQYGPILDTSFADVTVATVRRAQRDGRLPA